MKRKSKFNHILLTIIKAFWLIFLAFILPGWRSQTRLTAQVDPTKASSEATASAQPTETLPAATEAPAPTKANTPTTPEPQPTKDTGGIGAAAGQWVVIASQNFEGIFPATGWAVQDLSNDGYERFWDDDNYRPHLGSWAGWPARGGAHGLNPTSSNNNYFNNMDTRMIYGPFDLSNASRADTDFYLWRELESCCDYLAFEISHDGINFQEVITWTTTSKVWEFKDIYYDNFVGDSSVWIAWRFYSDYSITYDGPWIDNIHVWKFVPDPATSTSTRTVTRPPTGTPTRTPTRTPTQASTPQTGKVYLPMVLKDYPRIKTKSGIHVGNRGNGDWNANHLIRLKGTDQGAWPKAVVILSSQLYYLDRPTAPPCKIAQARVKATELYTYVTDAIKNGTTVIIRIEPSPGNFTDHSDPAAGHNLLASTVPAGGDYCNGKQNQFRAIDDLAIEMNEIYKLNVNQMSWPASSFFFEPANEPNKEWYHDWAANRDPNISPQEYDALAWQGMDSYFSALYDYTKGLNVNIQVLTPPMAQDLYAESIAFQTCQLREVAGGGSGYDWMRNTYTLKNDGYTWHNYWRQAKEFWSNNFCSSQNLLPSSDHLFQYFPAWLQTEITSSSKPAFITEADLLSPCPQAQHNLTNKDSQADAAGESMWRFISEEQGADIVVAWLLSESPHYPPACASPSGVTWSSEIAWHEAYRDDGTERSWFPLWWLRDE